MKNLFLYITLCALCLSCKQSNLAQVDEQPQATTVTKSAHVDCGHDHSNGNPALMGLPIPQHLDSDIQNHLSPVFSDNTLTVSQINTLYNVTAEMANGETYPVNQQYVSYTNGANFVINVISTSEAQSTLSFPNGLEGFNGSVVFHNLDKSVAKIETYNNGQLSATALNPTTESAAEILNGVKLSKIETNITRTSTGQKYCDICLKYSCQSPYDMYVYYNLDIPSEYGKYLKNEANKEKHCKICNKTKCEHYPEENIYTCRICGVKGCMQHNNTCPTCGVLGCTINHSGGTTPCHYCDASCSGRIDPRILPTVEHVSRIKSLFKNLISTQALHNLQSGSHSLDISDISSGYEYKHNLCRQSASMEAERTKLRNYFISDIKSFKSSSGDPSYGLLGNAMHPILDFYTSISSRVARLNYFTYDSFHSVSPRTSGGSDSEIMDMYYSILQLPQYPTDAQVGQIYDNWCNVLN